MMLSQGATIGIIGGGQLGRMLASAALELGFRVHVYAPPDADNVAFAAAHKGVVAAYDDHAAMLAFAQDVDVITYEFENVPVAALEGSQTPVWPPVGALSAAQDRLVEKAFLETCGFKVATHLPVNSAAELDEARKTIPNGFLKARRFGYDGKGQARIAPGVASDAAMAAISGVPAILEAAVNFRAETSIVLVRGEDGSTRSYTPTTNLHDGGILRRTHFETPLPPQVVDEAARLTAVAAEALGYVGVITVEFFVTDDADAPLIANEFAPRVHNTGHWTMDGALTSQFENHIRAVAGWPLGAVDRIADVTMVNLLGDDIDALSEHIKNPAARVHIYNKRAASPGRKMGHVNLLKRTVDFDAERC
ncbi:MAG: 5-(carboxyamino)imidazole ribonucleotide synthase [Pseudomonadota bacterium]